MMSQAYRLTREEAQFIDKLRELKDASAVSELSKDPRLNTIVDVNSWNGEKYLGHYQVDARNLVLELADVAVENMKRILTGKDYRLYPEDIEISSIGDNESTRSVQTAAADEVTEGGVIFDEASATVPADEVKGAIEVEAYETMSAKSIQELAVSRSTQTTVSLSNKNGSDLTLSAVLSLEETNHGLAVVPDDINQTQIIQVSVTGQQNGENADRDMTTSNSPERLAKAPISLEQNRIKEDAEKVIRNLGGTVNWGSESKMSSKHELEKIKATKVTAPRTTLRQRTNSQASQSTKAHTQEVNTTTRPSLARQPMERRASSRQLSIATPPAAVKDPEDNFRINTDINSRDSHSANISDISRAYTPSERVDALYKHWCTSGRIPVQRNRGTLPAGKSELFPNGDQSRANKAYEDMLDLMIYAQHRDVRDGFEMDVLKAWQQTDFGTKFEGDEYGALPDLRIVDKAFQRLPNDHFLLRYLVSYFSFVWVTAKAEVSFDDYKPRGAAFERFLFGICVQSDVPATHLGNTMLWRWCEFHDHGEEGRQACHKWRDETVLKGMEWKKEWEIGIKKQTQVNRSLEDLNVDLFKGGIAKPKTNNEKTLAKRNTHKSTEVESVPMTNQATASQVEDSMSPDRVTNDDLYRSPTPAAATRRNYSGRPQMITRNSVQKETNTTGHSTPIQDSIDEKHADGYVEPGNRPIAEFRRRFAESRASSLPTQSKHTEDAALRTTARIPEPHSPRSARSEELAVSRGLQRRGSVESTNEGISDGDDTNDMPIRRSGRKRAAPEGWYNQTPKKRDFGKTMWSKFEE